MEINANDLTLDNSDSESEDVFMGAVTKREILARLKHYKNMSDTSPDKENLNKMENAETTEENVSSRRENTLEESFQSETFDSTTSFDDSMQRSNLGIKNWNMSLPNFSIKPIDDSLTETSDYGEEEGDNSVIVIEDSIISDTSECVFVPNSKIKTENIVEDSEEEIHDLEKSVSNILIRTSAENEGTKNIGDTNKSTDEINSILSESFISKHTEQSCLDASLNIIDNQTPVSLSTSSISDNSYVETSYSTSNNDSTTFNDTLEEMEMLLKFGENYMKHDDKQGLGSLTKHENRNKNSPTKFDSKLLPTTPIEKNSTEIFDYENKENEVTPLKVPVIEKGKTPILKKGSIEKTQFKVPVKAPLIRKSPNYKHIVSPISLYIKNSPKVPLMKKVVTSTTHSSTCRVLDTNKSSETVPENTPSSKKTLPIRSYKMAAKKVFLSKETEPNIPNNIRKLIKGPLNPEVIKHVGRVKASDDMVQSPSTNFKNNTELTMLSSTSSSDAMFNVSTGPGGDVSLYVSKNAARTNSSAK